MYVEGGGWSKKKRRAFEAGFREFLNHVTINSKDTGPIILGKNLFDAQERFIKEVFDALEADIHDIYILKSRQLGASTLTRAFSVFWLGMHPGLTGALVFDTDSNKKSARREIENLIRSLPKSMQFPSITATNREGLTLDNQSTILFLAAGIKVSKGSGTLGRSIGLSYGHQSEMCSWANPEGLIAYRQSLSKIHPNRLYIWESTARGYNDWWRMWVEAKADEGQKRCLFLGWWSKPSQMIRRSHPDFKKFGLQPPTATEQEKILQVKEWYGYQITPEQLAWIRKDSDPLASAEDGDEIEYEADSWHLSEQPWTEEDAFQQSGSKFFPAEALKKATDEHVRNPDKTYSFATFAEFIDTRIHQAANPRQVQLKVWEEPEPGDAWYVIAADPAYGSSERSDRSVIQVLRCFADGCDQVAEYAWPLVGTRQFAWAILAVAGHYATNNEVRLIVELNGPGRAVWDEIIAVKRHIASGYQPKEVDDLGIRRVFANVKNYIYTRNDSMDSGKAWQWTTSGGNGPASKVRVLERMRDAISTDRLHIRSLDLIEEMKSVERNEEEGDEIAAGGSGKDDRVIAMALAVHCWDDRVVPTMSARKRTRENEYNRRRLTIADMSSLYMKAQFEDMLKRKQVQRKSQMRALRMAQRGYR
jgi:hypothetical protein